MRSPYTKETKETKNFVVRPSASETVHESRRSRAGVSPSWGRRLRRGAGVSPAAGPLALALEFGNLPRQFEEVFGEREHGAVQTLDLRIGGLDDIIFVRSMGAAPVAQPEMAGRELERFAGEQIAGPGTGHSRPEQRINPMTAVHRDLGPDQR